MFTILIQGPLNRVSLDYVDKYKKIGPVILSFWKNDKNKVRHPVLNDPSIKLIENNSVNKSDIFSPDNRLKQWQTTYEGLKYCSTKFVIKLRSDEYFENLETIIEEFKKDVGKMTTLNVFLKLNHKRYCYHISDHIIICNTLIFRNSLKLLFNDLNKKYTYTRISYKYFHKFYNNWLFGIIIKIIDKQLSSKYIWETGCESIFGTYFIMAKLKLNYWSAVKIREQINIQDFFSNIDVNKFKNYQITWNAIGRVKGKNKIVFNKKNPFSEKFNDDN